MLSLNTQDIFALRDGTGIPFTDLIDSLIRATSSRLPIRPINIHTNMRVNIPDAGVDTQVEVDGHDPEGRLTPPTLWQYKATEYKNITEAVIRAEITEHEYVKQLIKKNYGYRLCICDDIPVKSKLEKLATLDSAIREVNRDAPAALIVTASDLVAWANQYPSVVAKSKRLATDRFRFFESWKQSATFLTPTFVPTPRFESLRHSVEEHVDWSRNPVSIALTIYGEAGVGKTRSVLQALDELENHRELVVYTADEDEARELAIYLANDNSLKAILVADECLTTTLVRLEEILRGYVDRVRVLTIDNAKERHSSLAPQLQVLHLSEQETGHVLAANFPQVSQERRRQYAFLSAGFLRLAADMCQRDALIAQRGDVSPVLESANNYYVDRMATGDREALELLSLVDRIGYREDLTQELELLCRLVGIDRGDTQRRLERLRDAPGFVVNAGRYYYVTPALIAMIAFESGWSRWIRQDPQDFLGSLPNELILPFQRRVSTSASQEVAREVAKFFRDWSLSVRPEIFASEPETRKFFALLETDPEIHVPVLRRLVESATLVQLDKRPLRGGASPRREVIWMTERLARFPEFFRDSEAILFRLAKEETEPSIGNNATKTWQALFWIFMSGSSLPLIPDRIEILRHRYEPGDRPTQLLVLGAVEESLRQQSFKLLGPPIFGTRLPPEDWRPKTREEYRSCISALLQMLSAATSSPDPHVHTRAQDIVIQGIYGVFLTGAIDLLAHVFRPDELANDFRPRLASAARESLNLASSRQIDTPAPNDLSQLALWSETLRVNSLHGRIVEEVASRPWGHHDEEEAWRNRLRTIASELLSNYEAFREELNWLNSAEAKAAAELGHFVGELDAQTFGVLDMTLEAALGYNSDTFARGYVFGLTRVAGINLDRLNGTLDEIEKANPLLSFYIAIAGGERTGSFERGVRLVRQEQISPALLGNFTVWIGSRKTEASEVRIAVDTLLPFLQSGDGVAGDVAVEFVSYQLAHCKTREDSLSRLIDIFQDRNLSIIWTLLGSVLLHPSREAFWFERLLGVVYPTDPGTACELCAEMMLSNNFHYSDAASKVFAALSSSYPELLMEAVGKYMLDPKQYRFFAGKFPYLAALPFNVVTDWLRRHGVAGSRPIARHLFPPFLDAEGKPQLHPLTEYVLREFDSDDRTFSEFVAGVHSFQSYVGSIATARASEAEVARTFLSHPLRRVRQWAEIEMRQAEAEAKRFQIMEEEADF
jgi:hypothetical protein